MRFFFNRLKSVAAFIAVLDSWRITDKYSDFFQYKYAKYCFFFFGLCCGSLNHEWGREERRVVLTVHTIAYGKKRKSLRKKTNKKTLVSLIQRQVIKTLLNIYNEITSKEKNTRFMEPISNNHGDLPLSLHSPNTFGTATSNKCSSEKGESSKQFWNYSFFLMDMYSAWWSVHFFQHLLKIKTLTFISFVRSFNIQYLMKLPCSFQQHNKTRPEHREPYKEERPQLH